MAGWRRNFGPPVAAQVHLRNTPRTLFRAAAHQQECLVVNLFAVAARRLRSSHQSAVSGRVYGANAEDDIVL